MCILSNIVDNSIYHLSVRYDWTRDTVVRFVGRPSTSILVCNIGTLHNSEMIYDMDNTTASMHTDRDIEDSTYQDGEHRMSTRDTRFDSILDNTTRNILNLEMVYGMSGMNANMHTEKNGEHHISEKNNDNMKDNMQTSYDQLGYILGNTMTTNNVLRSGNYKVCKYIKRDDNTCKCGNSQLMFECKGIGIGNGMYKCPTANMKYNTKAIRTSSWIVLTIGYMHTTLHQLESNEHKIVCSRLDGRGVTNFCNKYHIWGTHPISVN